MYKRTTGLSRKLAERERTQYLHLSARIVHDVKFAEDGKTVLKHFAYVEKGVTYRRPKP